MTTADAAADRDYAKDAVALVRMLKAHQSADAQSLLDSYTSTADQSGLTGNLALIATSLAACVDQISNGSIDVLSHFESLMCPADNGTSDKGSRGEPIGYL